MNKKQVRQDLLNLSIASIQAVAVSLAAQLSEYDFLYVTKDEAEKLDKIYTEFLELSKQITERH